MKRYRIVVVQGGPSNEAAVSRSSAKGIAEALKQKGHAVARMELDGHLAESIRGGGYDVVFPAVHGAVGEDGALQGLLEVLDVPYVGSGVLASALAMDKVMARRIFAAEGLPVARGIAIPRGETRAAAARARREVGRRLVVKPRASGSALGVARIGEDAPDDAVAEALEAAWAVDAVALVEHFAVGREVTCGVLDLSDALVSAPAEQGVSEARLWPLAPESAPPTVRREGGGLFGLPPTEIEAPADAFYSFRARYAPGRSVHRCPAPLGPELTERVQRVALAAHRALGCRDLSRVDFVVGDGDDHAAVTLLEVNTLPGFTPTSLYPEAAHGTGLGFAEVCDLLVRSAVARGATCRNTAEPLPA